MSTFQQLPVSAFFSKFIKDCEGYDEMDHVIQFEGATLSDSFLEQSNLPDERYSAVSFCLDDPEVVVYDRDEIDEKVVFSRLIECSLR